MKTAYVAALTLLMGCGSDEGSSVPATGGAGGVPGQGGGAGEVAATGGSSSQCPAGTPVYCDNGVDPAWCCQGGYACGDPPNGCQGPIPTVSPVCASWCAKLEVWPGCDEDPRLMSGECVLDCETVRSDHTSCLAETDADFNCALNSDSLSCDTSRHLTVNWCTAEHQAWQQCIGGSGTGLCSNTCMYAYDGECDDGGAGFVTSLCAYGTDCGDCGSRY